MLIYAVVNPKGGVGKSNTSRNLARAFQKQGLDVLLGETDPQGTLREWRARADNSDQPNVIELRTKTDISSTASCKYGVK